MVQVIKQEGSIAGRLGKGIAQGLSEQVPKEIERYRLARGLENLNKESANLNPLEFFTKALAIPGMTPQGIQSLGQLAQQQSVRNAYKRQSAPGQDRQREDIPDLLRQTEQSQQGQPGIQDVRFGNFPQTQQKKSFVQPNEIGQPQAATGNPLREEAVPLKEWTPEKRNAQRAKIAEEFPWMPPEQINEMAADDERRSLAQPAGEQAIDAYNEIQANKIKDAFTKRLELLTQKKGEDVFSDITGEMLNNFNRTVERDLRENPKLTIEDAVNARATELLQIPKIKSNLNVLANRDILDKISPSKKKQTLDSLLDAAKIFDKVGNNEELYNFLKTVNSPEKKGIGLSPSRPEKKGMGLSPSRAAQIAYPRSKHIYGLINMVKGGAKTEPERVHKYYASQIGKLIQPEDSILAIIQDISDKDPSFSPEYFLSEFKKIKNFEALSPHQQRELTEPRDLLPTWGDMSLFPIFKGGLL